MAKIERRGGIARGILAVVLGAIAAKLAMKGAEKLWSAAFRQGDVPAMTEGEPVARRAAWTALSAALVGVARELTRDLTAPKIDPEAGRA